MDRDPTPTPRADDVDELERHYQDLKALRSATDARHREVPGSPAYREAMAREERLIKRVHGWASRGLH